MPVFRSIELYRDRSEIEKFARVPFTFRYMQVFMYTHICIRTPPL